MEKTRRTVLQSQTSSTAAAHKKIRPEVPFDLYSFPFENVVFEGGSGNLLAYIGAVRVSHIPSTKYTKTILFNLIRRRMPPRCAIPTLNSSVGSYRIPMGSLPWTLKSISFPYRPYVLVWWAIATSIALRTGWRHIVADWSGGISVVLHRGPLVRYRRQWMVA